MTAFDPSSAQPAASGFDPSSAKPYTPPTPAPKTRYLPPNPVSQTAKNAIKGIESADVGLAARWDAIKRHPLASAIDVGGALQRGVAEGIREGMDPKYGEGDLGTRFHRMLHDVGQQVFETREGTLTGHGISDPQANVVRARAAESARAGIDAGLSAITGGHVHLATHAAIDSLVNGQKWIPAAAKPYVSGVMKGGEDVGVQTATDPFTALGGTIFRGVGALTKVATTFERAHAAAKAVGLGDAFTHLEPIYKGSSVIAQRVADHPAVSFFRTRPELENFSLGATSQKGAKVAGATGGFTAQGKKIRMQLENKASTQANNDRFIDDGLKTAADREGRVKDYIAQYGDSTMRAKLGALGHPIPQGAANAYLSKSSGIGSDVGTFLTKFRGMSDEEQIDALRVMRNDARDGSLAKKTESAVRLWNTAGNKTDQILKPGSVVSDFRKVPSESQAVSAIRRAGDEVAPVKAVRDIMRTSIFLNPLPHGIKNVGELAFMAGGFPAVFRGFKAMATGAIDRTRLTSMGALPEYTQHQLQESFWGKYLPGWSKIAGPMQAGMEHMEQGWRQGLLETLDKKLGPSAGLKDELLKGHMLQEHLGDYGNQSAMVHSFAALGGPFAAFRMGIVPKAILNTIQQNPQRVLLALRAKYSLQSQPNSKGDALVTGGPTDDFLKMTTDPLGFLLSPSTLGAIGGASQEAQYGQNDTPGQAIGRQLQSYNPVGEIGEIMNAIANGARPGEKENVADKLVDVTMLLFGAYFKREQTLKTQAAIAKRTGTQARKAYQPIMNALDSLGGAEMGAAPSGARFDPSTATASGGGGFDPSSARP